MDVEVLAGFLSYWKPPAVNRGSLCQRAHARQVHRGSIIGTFKAHKLGRADQ
ncbi:MAG: hypothetical protein CFH10_00542 [Alphaproteobacteria bacterium MarineAlpha4_Bin2]|nr:MAG: hypothetical protein CFH10_00542 [Alphaproteobacteria bacterium MarineAlpha4_Bin2]